ncbi:MAG: tRNA (adenosine(37)-N6)-dimethylallyltransferase MiaA [Synechococcales bacterium]|nr:tRNA (adenosine(37)-N6)-dimethylallyltransferase MiaA [Synechococcales bacterium]
MVPSLITLCGCTASGKSGLAIALAQRLQEHQLVPVIISADSRQLYREFTIGTAKPSRTEQTNIPHELIDVWDPRETATLAEFQAQAQAILHHCHQQGQIPLLVGGTGLYLKSITHGMVIPRVAPQPALRSQLAQLGQGTCYQLLQQVDAIAAEKIHPNDHTRTLRALEVFYVSGKPISQQQGEHPPDYPILQLGLESGQIDDRIQHRTTQMFAQDFVGEVQSLVEKYGDELPLLNTLGYQEVRQFLRGEITLAEAEELTILHTRQFAKRQRTWFRAYPNIQWFDADAIDLLDQVWVVVQVFLTQALPLLPR